MKASARAPPFAGAALARTSRETWTLTSVALSTERTIVLLKGAPPRALEILRSAAASEAGGGTGTRGATTLPLPLSLDLLRGRFSLS